MARITLWGFYQFTDKTLFDNIKLYECFDKQILIDLIMQQSGELFPFHQQPDYLKLNIENWFARMYDQFKRMHDAITAEYNPIENYNRTETETITGDLTETHSGNDVNRLSGQDVQAASGSDTLTNSGIYYKI